MDVREIADRINGCAEALARELLPNGHMSGNKWMFSGIADHGQSASAYVVLSGPTMGKWFDMGNAAPGEERGDMLDLLRLKLGISARDAIAEAKVRLGIEDDFKPGTRPQMSPEERARRAAEAAERARVRQAEVDAQKEVKARRAKGAWLSGDPIDRGPADRYLRGRGLSPDPFPEWPGALRYHPEMWCKPLGCKMPAMMAAIYRADGEQIGTHRTFIQRCPSRGWAKIDHENAKMVLGNMWGGFIPISKGSSGLSMRDMPGGEPVYVTEGIEDAIVVRMMKPAARIICAISLGNIGAIVLPAQARQLVVVCDRDENAKAQDQLERSMAQQQARGLIVQTVMPPVGVKDMNDWLRAWQRLRSNESAGKPRMAG